MSRRTLFGTTCGLGFFGLCLSTYVGLSHRMQVIVLLLGGVLFVLGLWGLLIKADDNLN